MRRGTTPTFRITVGQDVSGMSLYLAFKQRGEKVIVKRESEMAVSTEDTIGSDGVTRTVTVLTVALTQADTLKLKAREKCEVQLRAVRDGGSTALASDIGTLSVGRILQDGELHG